VGNNKVDSSWEFVCENRIKSRGEAEKLSPGICKNKALGLFESVQGYKKGEFIELQQEDSIFYNKMEMNWWEKYDVIFSGDDICIKHRKII
jgi:hypothetical protein